MLFNGESFENAMGIFTKLQQNGTFHKKEGPSLFQTFRDDEVFHLITRLQEINKVRIVKIDERIEMIPEVDNDIYRYTNEELRKLMGFSMNKELYTTQLMWMIIMGKFYGDQYENTGEPRAFVPIDEVLDAMNECVGTFKKQKKEKIDEMTEKYEISISEIIETWDKLGTIDENTKSIVRSISKDFGFMWKGIKFWEEQKIVVVHEKTEIVLTERGRIIPELYYHQKDNIQKIENIMKELNTEKETETTEKVGR